MGPRLDNRGWAATQRRRGAFGKTLQWVHGWITVVGLGGNLDEGAGSPASMGPRLDNRGWAARCPCLQVPPPLASMGPRLDNRGWA